MRKYAILTEPKNGIKMIAIYTYSETEVYLFEYTTTSKYAYSDNDWLWWSVERAEEHALSFGVNNGWTVIDDPLPDCKMDIIYPVRLKWRSTAKPEHEIYETLIDGEWVELAEGVVQ
ncbi:MAG: hypothetical protein LBN02_05845 [Oscillospiraceae bacterium]|jgi:hypothetical protein|nr:hypothetical protein [Oscillospiraceae bacterium]